MRAIIIAILMTVSSSVLGAPTHSPAYDSPAGSTFSGGTLSSDLDLDGNNIIGTNDFYPATLASDTAPNDAVMKPGQNAYSEATVNTAGGHTMFCSGTGVRKIAIVQATAGGNTLTFSVDGTRTTVTTDTEWNCTTDNSTCAGELETYLDANIAGLTATAVGTDVYLVPGVTTCDIVLTSANGGGTAFVVTSGVSGYINLYGQRLSFDIDDGTAPDTYCTGADSLDRITCYVNGTRTFRIQQGSVVFEGTSANFSNVFIYNASAALEFGSDHAVGHSLAGGDVSFGADVGIINDLFVDNDTTIGGDLNVTGTIAGTGQRGQMQDEDNTDAFVINDTALFHVYHTDGMTSAHLNGWTFDAGGAGASVAIASVADGGGGEIAVTTGAAHGLAVGDVVSQTNMSVVAYDGVFHVNTITSSTIYEVTATIGATATGTMDQAATLTAATGSGGEYLVTWTASATSATNNETFDWHVHVEAASVAGTKMRRKFGTSTDFGAMSASAFVTIADDDKVAFCLQNNDSGGDLTIRHFTMTLHRL